MNARANLITALLTLSLIGPAAAGAQIPSDRGTSLFKQPKIHLYTVSASHSTIGGSASGNWAAYVHGGASKEVGKAIATRANYVSVSANSAAYVHGGASTKVAKAITAAAKSTRASINVCASVAQYRVPC